MSETCGKLLETKLRDGLTGGSEFVWVPGAKFIMGSDNHYSEESPAHPVIVDGFWIQADLVTNRDFSHFVTATGYVTLAEKVPDPQKHQNAIPDMLKPGSLVFHQPITLDGPNIEQWWSFEFGASWQHPLGPLSDISALQDHPVVHIAYCDAVAYAEWAGMQLPSEAEWELAAKGGLADAEYAWGSEFSPDGKTMANTWQGMFPVQNDKLGEEDRTSPCRTFPANGYGIFDMIGNVWEWTADCWSDRHTKPESKVCCIPKNPRVVFDDAQLSEIDLPRMVLKGGSHLCAPNYCRRYRPAARIGQTADTSTSHVGFRCVLRPVRQ